VEFQFEDALPVLRRTPAVLRGLLLDLPDSWIVATEGPVPGVRLTSSGI
jgi:hypothetical protein